MAAPKGNKFWEARSSHGRKPIFESPDQLWKACCEYFQWTEDNPLMAVETVKFQGKATLIKLPRLRAMTISGLCLYLDIALVTWKDYASKEDFSYICGQVEQMIYNQKLQGAAADLFNANIIARELGLSDKTETNVSGRLEVTDMTEEQLDAKLQGLIDESGLSE